MKTGFLVILFLVVSLISAAQQIDTIKVKVHDHIMTLYVAGKGKPAVILEAGGSSNHKTWNSVLPKIANDTRVVSYDRPGYLNSDTCTSPRDAITIAKELKEALLKANIPPPYILSGWSYGGSLVRVFAGLYPKDVVGLILVDPAPEEVYARLEKEFPEMMKEDEKYMQEILTSKTRPGEREEMRMYDSSMNQGRRSDQLHSTPTTLLIASGKADGGQDRDPSNPMNKAWIEELEKWAKKRPNLTYKLITNSGHHIARFQPDTVINAIRHHIDQYHSKTLKQSAVPYKKPDQLNDGIQTGTLKEVGLDEKIIQTMVDSIVNGNYPHIHSVLILRNNKLVFENYWPGHDENRATNFEGVINHHRDSLHDMRSVTKSIISAAVMIAVSQGKIRSLDQRVFDFFPEYARYDTGMKKQITIQHLLNMSSGLNWSNDDPDLDDSLKINNVPYALDFILKQPLVSTPGAKFFYNNSSTQLLAAIHERATRTNIEEFTTKYLFEPLGIKHWDWTKENNGMICAWAGLRMRSRDMVKFGMLYMNEGKWNGKQIIPSHLVSATLNSQIKVGDMLPNFPHIGYSNQFWHYTEVIKADTSRYALCVGNGGQLIIQDKKNHLLLIITAGTYNLRGRRKIHEEDIYADFVYPAIIK
jgi:CubicO group peptidase (beta-lactamase class C family)/pimeloyl-ACP methyl ester carboxylesterase